MRFPLSRLVVAGVSVTEVDASYAVMLSRPDVVTGFIEQAAR